jgi:hypothetical protein
LHGHFVFNFFRLPGQYIQQDAIDAVALSSNGSYCALAAHDERGPALIIITTNKHDISTITTHYPPHKIKALTFTPNEKCLIIIMENPTTLLYSIYETKECLNYCYNPLISGFLQTNTINSVALSDCLNYCAVAGNENIHIANHIQNLVHFVKIPPGYICTSLALWPQYNNLIVTYRTKNIAVNPADQIIIYNFNDIIQQKPHHHFVYEEGLIKGCLSEIRCNTLYNAPFYNTEPFNPNEENKLALTFNDNYRASYSKTSIFIKASYLQTFSYEELDVIIKTIGHYNNEFFNQIIQNVHIPDTLSPEETKLVESIHENAILSLC